MKAVGITVIWAGVFFTVVSFFSDPEVSTHTSGWEPWIGLLVIVTGVVTILRAREK